MRRPYCVRATYRQACITVTRTQLLILIIEEEPLIESAQRKKLGSSNEHGSSTRPGRRIDSADAVTCGQLARLKWSKRGIQEFTHPGFLWKQLSPCNARARSNQLTCQQSQPPLRKGELQVSMRHAQEHNIWINQQNVIV
jgi:hypothetical protein